MARRKIDSMGLMIDTMCNGVGGLVLVAVLVILISLGTSPSSKEGQMKHQKLQNEVVALEIKQQVLDADTTRLASVIDAGDSSIIDLISEKEMELLTAHQLKLSAEETQLLQAVEKTQGEIQAAEFLDPGAFLEAEMARLHDKEAVGDEAGDTLSKKQEVLASVENAHQALLEEVAKEKEERHQKIKAPKEREYVGYVYIYFRQGTCYLVEEPGYPPSSVDVLYRSESGIMFEPIANLGVAITSSQVQAFLAASARERKCCILGFYPDSFSLYSPIIKMLDEWNLPHGVGFFNDEIHPSFSVTGKTIGLGQ